MPTTRYLEFSGAMNTKVSQFLMQDNELNLAKNADMSTIGAISKAGGYSNYGAAVVGTNKMILGLSEYVCNSDNTRTTIATAYDTIYAYDGGTGNWTAYTGAGTGLTANKNMQFETYLDSLFAVNGTDANRVLTGGAWSTTTYLGGSPICSYIKKYHDALYLAGNSSKKNRVWKSDIPSGNKLTWGWATGTNGTNTGAVFTSSGATFKTSNIKIGDTLRIISGTTTTTGDYIIKSVDSETQLTLSEAPATNGSSMTYEAGSNWFEPGADDGDSITGFGENSDRLLVFKNGSLYRWDGSVPMRVADVGTASGRSVVNIDTWTLFANRKGVYVYDGSSVKLISLKMQKFIDAIGQSSLVNMVGWADGNQYKLYIGDVTVDGIDYIKCVLVYDINQNNWWFYSLANTVYVVSRALVSNKSTCIFGSTNSYVYMMDSSKLYGTTAIDMVIKGKNYDFGLPEIYKKITKVTVFCSNAEGSTFSLISDNGDPITIGQLQNGDTSFNCDVRGLRICPMVIHSDQYSRPVIEGYVFEWEKDGEL